MTDLASLGYPEGFHLGLSSLLWWITIFVLVVLAVLLYLNARKSDLINVKEMLLSKSIAYIAHSTLILLIQVGIFYLDYFTQLYLLGVCLTTLAITFYYYYWEKNLMSIKHIPTLSSAAATVISMVSVIISIFFPNLIGILLNLLLFTALSLLTIAAILYIYIIFVFSKNVKGISTTVGVLWMMGMAFAMIGLSIEHPPGVKIFPAFIVLYIAPIVLMIGWTMATYGIIRLFSQISSYYAQTQRCVVHRGVIAKGNPIYSCPSCGITYCMKCFNQVIKKDGCWNCRKGAETEIEEEWKAEIAVEMEKADKHKSKN